MRLLGSVKTRSEQVGAGWSLPFGHDMDSHYHLLPRSGTYRNTNPDFDYLHTTNVLGFVGPMPSEEKRGRRIVFLGDSFTEGVGAASPDSSFPKLVQDLLVRQYPDAAVEGLNFGVGGSDVVFAAKYLQDSIAHLRPDLVVMMFNNSDVHDIIQRGGWERFLADGTTRFNRGPWFLPLFRYSHLFRLVVVNGAGYDAELLMHRAQLRAEMEKGVDIAVATAAEARRMSDGMGADFLFVLMPFCGELTHQRNEVSVQFDAMADALRVKQVPALNLFDTMSVVIDRRNAHQYAWWRHDGHYKHTGYLLMARIIANSAPVQSLFSARTKP